MVAVALVGAVALSGCIVSQTGSPLIVADQSAELTGNLNSDRNEPHASFWFEYGTTTGYGAATAHTAVGVSPGSRPVSDFADGLLAATTYHYRLCSDSPDDAVAAGCGSDQIVRTTTGRVSVHGQGSYFFRQSPESAVSAGISIRAAADAATGGTVEGDAGAWITIQTPNGVLNDSSTGTVECLRVVGNIAVAEITLSSPIFGVSSELLAIEDNGSTPGGDRYVELPPGPCPTPSPSLFTTGAHSGDFVVQGS